MPTCSRQILILSVGLLHAALALSSTQETDALKVTHAERSLAPGEIMLFRIQSPKALSDLRATAFGREFRMFSESGVDSWIGLVGIDMDTRPGTYAVQFHGVDKSGQPLTSTERINVISKSFPKRVLTVDPKFVNPPPEVMDRIRQESERVRIIFDSTAAERYWRGKFVVPVPGPVISDFGKRSVYNGQQRSSHAGTDFRGAAGTPIHAPNAGRVVLAENLYYSGNTVIIDHGLGLYTYLGHMSEFGVKEGERVERGAVVGKVGATGLVTGPHLHWSVRLAGARVDPVSLLDLPGPLGKEISEHYFKSAAQERSNAMLVLGSSQPGTRATRVGLACDLLGKGGVHFDAVILSGGCGAHGTDEANCEAADMKRLLEAVCPGSISGLGIYLEERSKSTVENYCNSRALENQGLKLIRPQSTLYVVSSHYHALSVAACFGSEGVDAHYYYTCGDRLYAGAAPPAAAVAASTTPCFMDYTDIARRCGASDWCQQPRN